MGVQFDKHESDIDRTVRTGQGEVLLPINHNYNTIRGRRLDRMKLWG